MLNFSNALFALRMNSFCLICVLIFGIAVSTGCNRGEGIDRCVVSGTVNFDGAPLANGEIRFRAESGPLSGGPIKDGRYKVEHNGGVPIGKHTVTVTARRMLKSNDGADGMGGMSGGDEQFIPEKYNEKSILTADITGDEKRQEINFDLGL